MSSMPQHAVAKGIGHRLDRRAQLMTRCRLVVRNPSTGMAASRPMPDGRGPRARSVLRETGLVDGLLRPEEPVVDRPAALVGLRDAVLVGSEPVGAHDPLVAP